MPAVISADGTWIGYSATGTGPTLIYIGGVPMYRAIDECGAGMAAALSSRWKRCCRQRGIEPTWMALSVHMGLGQNGLIL
jgi:hypothetical protein